MITPGTNEYFSWLRELRDRYQRLWQPFCDPYTILHDGVQNLTPIEKNVWEDIRYLAVPFYPQFPIGNYFVDFADPIGKIAIEVDGKIHTRKQNMLKDEQRDKDLRRAGWRVYRIRGDQTWKTYWEIYPTDAEQWHFLDEDERLALDLKFSQTSEGILFDIAGEYHRLWDAERKKAIEIEKQKYPELYKALPFDFIAV